MLYRIQTESDHMNCRHREFRENIVKIVSRYFDGFTIINCQGFWKGKPEDSVIIEIIGNDEIEKIKAIADEIRPVNRRECVLVTCSECRFEFRDIDSAKLTGRIYGIGSIE
jgi:hypothetical protein